jgi:hypothetical protein
MADGAGAWHSLTIAGMVTHWVISLLGVVLALRSTVGWFFEVLPHEHHASVPVHAEEIVISTTRKRHEQVAIDPKHRKLLPVETFSIAAGIKGGIARRNCNGRSRNRIQPAQIPQPVVRR